MSLEDSYLGGLFQDEFEFIEMTAPEINNLDKEVEVVNEGSDIEAVNENKEEVNNTVPGQDYRGEENKDKEGEATEKEERKLNKDQIIKLTNDERRAYGRDHLEESFPLNLAAEKKAEDMLNREYFAHTAPTGEEAADLVEDVDYSFIFVGENLAKGNFSGDESLVNGWMNSPDHKENILSDNYEEIGVGLKKGYFEGQEVWMAVQIFGTPSSSCPEPNGHLLNLIDDLEEEISRLGEEIEEMDDELSDLSGREYNEKVVERNEVAEKYNLSRDQLVNLIEEYNFQVEKRNECLNSY